ncbi:MAG: polyphosphate polymerase domain-containing protein [Thiolinea sp.]
MQIKNTKHNHSAIRDNSRDFNIPADCRPLVSGYTGHGLEDLQQARLMNRVDMKFLLPRSVLPDLLDSMRSFYSMLEIGGKRCFEYQNDYYDTQEMALYRAHHNGWLNRYKVRCRQYVDSKAFFLEIKHKDNKKRTRKTRMQLSSRGEVLSEPGFELMRSCGFQRPESLLLVQQGGYHRMALANESEGERLTIDINLSFSDVRRHYGRWELPNQIIVELKQEKRDRRSPFYCWAKQRRFRPLSFSKYCMGVYHTAGSGIKRNRFREIDRHIQRM